MSEHRGTCRRETLATGPVSKVERCAGCGQIHLHVGAMSLRLESEAFLAVLLNMLDAAQEMEPAPAGRLHS